MKAKEKTKGIRVIKYILFFAVTAIICFLSALMGYGTAAKHSGTIIDKYNSEVSNITGRINNIESTVLDETSKLSGIEAERSE